MHNYSPEDLVMYLYKETSPETTGLIDKALETDWTLREKLAVLKASADRLNTLKQSPRTETILNIFKYAANQEITISK